MRTLKRTIAMYHKGAITGHELVSHVIQSGAEHPPEEILPLVPPELIPEVRERGINPPARPDILRCFSVVCATGAKDEAWGRRDQKAYYDGAWHWHRFLNEPVVPHDHGGEA